MSKETDYNEIQRSFEGFIKAWESGRTDDIDSFMLADAYVKFSIFGEGFLSRETLKENLKCFTKMPARRVLKALNFVCLTGGGKARVSAGISGIFYDDPSGDRYWFTGMAVAAFEHKASGWKISELRFELLNDNTRKLLRDSEGRLLIEEGTKNTFTGNWKPVNDRNGWFTGCPIPVVSGEYDAPWYVIRNRDSNGTDEDQIRELFYRYCFGLDMDAFELWNDIFLPDSIINFRMFGPMDPRKGAAVMKLMREEVARRTHHIGYFTSLDIEGNEARADICRVISGEHFAMDLPEEIRQRAAARFYMNSKKIGNKWYITEIGAR